jgi:hypothetical protein
MYTECVALCVIVLCAGPVCPFLQEWIQAPLQNEKIYLQGTDSTGRALAIVRVADHVADKKALKNMKLFVCYTMNAMVSTQCETPWPTKHQLFFGPLPAAASWQSTEQDTFRAHTITSHGI